ncbi:MAG TPA: hypothetical protein VEJ63_23460 [Planctomycetota bacterium]|nr:hypothetical protein [Planctomycetota bacterium]
MKSFFDADIHNGAVGVFECQLAGGIVEGATFYSELASAYPTANWLLQEKISLLIGPNDTRFPLSSTKVVALEYGHDEWQRVLSLPDRDWHALANCGAVLRLMLPPGPRSTAGVSRLAQRFPQTRFLIDPFRHGPEPTAGWQSHVCLANHRNVWLTTGGLLEERWHDAIICSDPSGWAVHHALHFVIGEVGAGRLLFASGLSLDLILCAVLGERPWHDGAAHFDADAWLSRVPFLDPAQRELIRFTNARDLFRI